MTYLGCYTTEDDPLVLASNSDALDYALITSCEIAKKLEPSALLSAVVHLAKLRSEFRLR